MSLGLEKEVKGKDVGVTRGGGGGAWGREYVDRETIKYLQSKRACRHSMVVGNILTVKKQKNKQKTKKRLRYHSLVIRYLAKIQQ